MRDDVCMLGPVLASSLSHHLKIWPVATPHFWMLFPLLRSGDVVSKWEGQYMEKVVGGLTQETAVCGLCQTKIIVDLF